MRQILLLLAIVMSASACGGEQSVSGWVLSVQQNSDVIAFTLRTDANPPTDIALEIVGQLEGGGENFDANHLLDHAMKQLPVALSFITDSAGRNIVVRATDATWLNKQTPPTLP